MNVIDGRLQEIAVTFSVPLQDDIAALQESCFERAYLACSNKEWHFFESHRIPLSLLTNRLGHTLLIRALIRNDAQVVIGLTKRRIAVLTPDSFGHTPLCFIKAGVGGENCKLYQDLVEKSAKALTDRLPEEERLGQVELMNEHIHSMEAEAQKALEYGGYQWANTAYKEIVGWYRKYWGKAHPSLITNIHRLGKAYERLENLPMAAKFFMKALTLLIEMFGDDHPEVPITLSEVAFIYTKVPKQYFQTGIKLEPILERAMRSFGEDHPSILLSVGCLGKIFFSVSRYFHAAKYYEIGVRVTQRSTSFKHIEVAYRTSHIHLAQCYNRLDRGKEGNELMLPLLEDLTKRYGNDHIEIAESLRVCGEGHLQQLDYEAAEKYFNRAKTIIENIHGKRSLALAEMCSSLAEMYWCVDSYHEAELECRLALEIFEEQEPHPKKLYMDVLKMLGLIYERMGNFSEAEKYLERVHDFLRTRLPEDDPEVIAVMTHKASLWSTFGLYKASKELSLHVLALGEKVFGSKDPQLVEILVILGTLNTRSKEMRDLQSAKNYFLRALSIAEASKNTSILPPILTGLGSVCCDLAEFKEARSYHFRASKLFETSGTPDIFGRHLINVAVLCAVTNEPEMVIRYMNQAIELFRQTNSTSLATALTFFGGQLFLQGKISEGMEKIDEAIAVCEELQAKESSDQWKITIFEYQHQAYSEREEMLLAQASDDRQAEALEASDFRKARSLTSLLHKRAFKGELKGLKVDEISEVAKKQASTFIILSHAESFFGFVNLWLVQPSGEIKHRRIPAEGIAESCGITVSETSFPFKNGDSNQSTPLAGVLEEMESTVQAKGTASATIEKKRKELRDSFNEYLRKWYETLICPVEEFLPQIEGSRVVFIPDQDLSTIPFHLLCGPKGYFFERYSVTTAPSVKILDLLSRRRSTQEIPSEMLIVDDPKTNSMPLKTGGEESSILKGLIGDKFVNILAHERATVENVLSRISSAGRVHFSCHGSAALSTHHLSIYKGGLFLAPDSIHKNGNLLAEEIVDTTTNTDLVFVSACSTGLGSVQKDGIIGLVRSFLASGASTVVASGWKVSDSKITVQMVQHFYHALIKDGLDKAQALRQAMVFAKNMDPSAIEQWGVFFLTGLA